MEDFDQVVTFHTHYAALMFRKRFGRNAELHPVPRALSSSCGTAAFIKGCVSCEMLDDSVEGVWEKDGNSWKKIM